MRQNFTGECGWKERRLAYEKEPAYAAGGAARYNISRAFAEVQTMNPLDPRQAAAGVIDMAHAIGFKGGSDLLKLIRGDNEPMAPLGGWQRVKESTLGALENIGGGFARTVGLSSKGFQPVRGVLQMGQGALDAFDVIPGVIADGTRIVTNVDSRSTSMHKNMRTLLSSNSSAAPLSTTARHGA